MSELLCNVYVVGSNLRRKGFCKQPATHVVIIGPDSAITRHTCCKEHVATLTERAEANGFSVIRVEKLESGQEER